jgi:hypothetical protein
MGYEVFILPFQKKPLKRPKKRRRRLPAISDRMKQKQVTYRLLKQLHHPLHPYCEMKNGDCPNGDKLHPSERFPHHMRGREGRWLNDTTEWLWCCLAGHMKIEANRKWAKEQGYLKLRK